MQEIVHPFVACHGHTSPGETRSSWDSSSLTLPLVGALSPPGEAGGVSLLVQYGVDKRHCSYHPKRGRAVFRTNGGGDGTLCSKPYRSASLARRWTPPAPLRLPPAGHVAQRGDD